MTIAKSTVANVAVEEVAAKTNSSANDHRRSRRLVEAD